MILHKKIGNIGLDVCYVKACELDKFGCCMNFFKKFDNYLDDTLNSWYKNKFEK